MSFIYGITVAVRTCTYYLVLSAFFSNSISFDMYSPDSPSECWISDEQWHFYAWKKGAWIFPQNPPWNGWLEYGTTLPSRPFPWFGSSSASCLWSRSAGSRWTVSSWRMRWRFANTPHGIYENCTNDCSTWCCCWSDWSCCGSRVLWLLHFYITESAPLVSRNLYVSLFYGVYILTVLAIVLFAFDIIKFSAVGSSIYFFGRLIDWSINLLFEWVIDRLIDWLILADFFCGSSGESSWHLLMHSQTFFLAGPGIASPLVHLSQAPRRGPEQ